MKQKHNSLEDAIRAAVLDRPRPINADPLLAELVAKLSLDTAKLTDPIDPTNRATWPDDLQVTPALNQLSATLARHGFTTKEK